MSNQTDIKREPPGKIRFSKEKERSFFFFATIGALILWGITRIFQG